MVRDIDHDEFIEALKAHTLNRWNGQPRLARYRWLCRLEQRPAPSKAMAREGNRILRERREEFRQLRIDAATVMSLSEALAVLARPGADPDRIDDAQYVVMAYGRPGPWPRTRRAKVTMADIEAMIEADMFDGLSKRRQSKLIQVLRMHAHSETVATAKKARVLLAILDVAVRPPVKPRLVSGDDVDRRRATAARAGMVRRQVHVLYDEMLRKGGNTVVKEHPPMRYAAAMDMVRNGEALVLKDEVRTPSRGRLRRGDTEPRPRRVVVIGLTGRSPGTREDRI